MSVTVSPGQSGLRQPNRRGQAPPGRAGPGPGLRRQIEAIPLPAATVDVVISNCVVNLSTDKPAVFAETFRVLKPGGGAWVGCIAGALSKAEYEGGRVRAGLGRLHPPGGDGLHSAIIKATKPTNTNTATTTTAPAGRTTLPMAPDSGCC